MVTVIGSVLSRNNNALDPSEPCHFTVENINRWKKVKTPPSGAFLSVSAKVAGRTTDTNHRALRVLDLAYLPRPASDVAPPTPTTTPPSKRSNRWEGRTAPSTPSKRPRVLEPANEAVDLSEMDTTPPELKRGKRDLHIEHNTESPSARPSPSTIADAEESSLTSAPSLTSDSANSAAPQPSSSKEICRLGLDREESKFSLTRCRYPIKLSSSPFKLNAVGLSAPCLGVFRVSVGRRRALGSFGWHN
jgi:hypothetical protein